MSSGTTRAYDVLCEAKFDYFKSMIGYVCETQRDYCRIMMDCKSVTSTGAVEEYVRDPEGLLGFEPKISAGERPVAANFLRSFSSSLSLSPALDGSEQLAVRFVSFTL